MSEAAEALRAHSTEEVFERVRAQGRAAFIGYLPVGYPDVPTSIEAAKALVAGGADIVEVGMPYSDPGMDGGIIQHAGTTALAGGVRTRDLFPMVEAVADAGAHAVVMSYWNIVYQYGVERFARDLTAAGGSGIITPDLIPDEGAEWEEAADRYHLDRIYLVAPSSTPERLAYTVEHTRGFVYAASTMGVTGARTTIDSAAERLVADTRAAGAKNVCVGLGVSDRAQAAEVAGYADGVIIGSALVRTLGERGPEAVRALAEELALGVREGRR